MEKKKLKVGITGNIGSGKSEFSKFIMEAGYPVIQSDEISKQLLAEDKNVIQQVKKIFGTKAYVDGKPDHKYLSAIVFENEKKLVQLEEILHPPVIEKCNILIEGELQKKNIVFVESALIYEANIEQLFDYVILIKSEYENRKSRKLKQGLSEDQFEKRDQNQILQEEKQKRADFTFRNDTTLHDLKQKAELVLLMLNNL